MFRNRMLGGTAWLRSPENDGGAGGTGGAGDGNGEVKRPDFIPEKFWDAEKKAPRIEELAKSYIGLETKLGAQAQQLEPEIRKKVEAERFAKRPPKAEEYKIGELKDLKLPDGVSVKVIETHPLLGFWRQHCWDNGYSQEQFEAGIKSFAEVEARDIKGLDERLQELGEGDTGKARVRRVDAFISDHLESDEDYVAIVGMLKTPSQVKAFENLMKKVGKEPDMTKWKGRESRAAGGNAAGGGTVTLAALREIQADPRYWRDGDPELRKKVQEGYAQLYKGGQKRA